MKNKVIDLYRNNSFLPKSDVSYSILLEKFIKPFADELEGYEYLDDIFEFAIAIWNMANLKSILPDEGVAEAINSAKQNKKDILLVEKMIAHKEKHFKEYTSFIVDFEIEQLNDGENPLLTVVTQEEDVYLNNMNSMIENNLHAEEEEFKENFINRSAIIVIPKQPFIDWQNSLYPDSKIDESEVDIYLIDDTIKDLEKFLKKKFDTLFTNVLYDWHTNKKEWPQKRNYKMFNQWFRIETSETIYDLVKRPVLKSE